MSRVARVSVTLGVGGMVLAMVLGPSLSLDSYSSISHTTSELGGQSMPGAWLMNLGFAAYGLGVFIASVSTWRRAPLTHSILCLFGLGLIGAATFSTASLDPLAPFDPLEDQLHSLFASGLGFAFAATMASRLFGPKGQLTDALSWLGLLVSVFIPLAMFQLPQWDGALQRVMFSVSFAWVLHHFWRTLDRVTSTPPPEQR